MRVAIKADILDRLEDLHRQAVVERSHYYVGGCVQDAIAEIRALRKGVRDLMSAVEGEGYRIMVHIDSPSITLERRDKT